MSPVDCHISLLLDRSGSMDSIRDDIIGGVNRFWADQKAGGFAITASMVQFDSQNPFECLLENRPVAEVPVLDRETYQPRGQTPLLDAIGQAISSLDRHMESLPDGERPKRVVLVIVTDGQENASREFSRIQIGQLLTECEQKGWQVQFLSSDLNAVAEMRNLVPREAKVLNTKISQKEELHLALGDISATLLKNISS